MYQCGVCHHSSTSLKAYVRHYRFHRHVSNVLFPCCVTGCSRKFKTYNHFSVHMTREHRRQRCEQYGVASNANFNCQLENCQQICSSFSDLLSHVKSHIINGYEITCPFVNCNKKYHVKSSFTSHVSRNHRLMEAVDQQSEPSVSSSHSVSSSANLECTNYETQTKKLEENTHDLEFYSNSESEENDDEEEESRNLQELYVHNMALFYLRLQTKYHIPASTIQVIVNELGNIQHLQSLSIDMFLKSKLKSCGVEENVISSVLKDVGFQNLFSVAHGDTGPLRSHFTRKEFYKHNLSYVDPVTVKLGMDGSQTCRHFHYVPIKQSLEALLKDVSVQEQYLNPPSQEENVYADITDGSVFKNMEVFTRLQDSLKLILYQDSFEIVNPLGSAKKKHKINAMYYCLGNLYPHSRSKIDPIQLVALCKEEDLVYFGQDRVFARIVKDLKEIEENGINIPVKAESGPVKGFVVCILGDNLGSHYLGGFVQNFSCAQYMCRYCKVEREDMYSGDMEKHRTPERRTPQSYYAALNKIERFDLASFEGVKQNSIFNQLQNFHVCNPGLPPCIAHDVFEGIVQFDLALYIKYLVLEKKWFTYDELNVSLKQFHFLGSESLDKPSGLKTNGQRLGGHAVQNWVLLRTLPLIVRSRVKDPSDPVWCLILLLRQIVELVCAPKISTAQIAYLNILIEEYIGDRCVLFRDTKMRPKHHYLTHYPELIIEFGPLIHLWTMRMESKHTYFKWTARTSKNFINITRTLVETHQLLQAFHGAGSLFGKAVQVDEKAVVFHYELYSNNIKAAVLSVKELQCGSLASDTVVVHGTKYSKGMYVVLEKLEGNLYVGEIQLVVVSASSHPYLIVNRCRCIFLRDLGVYQVLKECEERIVCVCAEHLLDYHPLSGYNSEGNVFIVLKHAVLDVSLEPVPNAIRDRD